MRPVVPGLVSRLAEPPREAVPAMRSAPGPDGRRLLHDALRWRATLPQRLRALAARVAAGGRDAAGAAASEPRDLPRGRRGGRSRAGRSSRLLGSAAGG